MQQACIIYAIADGTTRSNCYHRQIIVAVLGTQSALLVAFPSLLRWLQHASMARGLSDMHKRLLSAHSWHANSNDSWLQALPNTRKPALHRHRETR
jgi:hypothetical protein